METLFSCPLPASRYDSELDDAGSYGLYWSSSLRTGLPLYAWYLNFNSDDYDMYLINRNYGLSVRPVCVSQN